MGFGKGEKFLHGGRGIALVRPDNFVVSGAWVHDRTCGYGFAFAVDMDTVVVVRPSIRPNKHNNMTGVVA
ncbi:MAG: hypothetical protein ACT4NP_00220 [Pseudonocardiales bacterium]